MSSHRQTTVERARARDRRPHDDLAHTIIAPQSDIDAAVARAEAATPLGIRGTSVGSLRVLNGRAYVCASFDTQDKYRVALARELSLIDARLTVADVDLEPGDEQLDALLTEAVQATSCRCTPQAVATRVGRKVYVGQYHHASCPFGVFLLRRLGPLGHTPAQPPREPEASSYKGNLDLHNPTAPTDQK